MVVRELSILDENPFPTLSEETQSFETDLGVFQREFSFVEKPLTRNKQPISFFEPPKIEEMERLLQILIETKPTPQEKLTRTLLSKSFTGSSKNLAEIKKGPGIDLEQEKLLKQRQGQGSKSLLKKQDSISKPVDIEYSQDFEPAYMNPLYDPNALSEDDQKKRNLHNNIERFIDEYEGVDIEMNDCFNTESLEELPTPSEEFYSLYVKRIERDLKFEKKEKNTQSVEKSILNPNSSKMKPIVKQDDDYEDGDTSLASTKNPDDIVKKLIVEVKNLKKRLGFLENYMEHDDDFLEDKAILTDYNSYDINNSDCMDEMMVNPVFCDDEVIEHFQTL